MTSHSGLTDAFDFHDSRASVDDRGIFLKYLFQLNNWNALFFLESPPAIILHVYKV
jgi:hypothetical protein